MSIDIFLLQSSLKSILEKKRVIIPIDDCYNGTYSPLSSVQFILLSLKVNDNLYDVLKQDDS